MVTSSDSGRRLSIYNTEDMKCSAKLRFESQSQINKLEVLVDPTSKYIFVVDYDCSVRFILFFSLDYNYLKLMHYYLKNSLIKKQILTFF